MNVTQEEAIPIEGHHTEICRFSGPEDERFEAVWKAIRRLIRRDESRRAYVFSPLFHSPLLCFGLI